MGEDIILRNSGRIPAGKNGFELMIEVSRRDAKTALRDVEFAWRIPPLNEVGLKPDDMVARDHWRYVTDVGQARRRRYANRGWTKV